MALQKYLKEQLTKILVRNIDMHGRRVVNANDAINLRDYVTKKQMDVALSGLGSEADSFEDNFDRADGDIGTNYIYQTIRILNADSWFGARIDTNRLSFVHYGTATANGRTIAYLPRSLIGSSKVWGQDQYAQMTLKSLNIGATGRLGGSLFLYTNLGYLNNQVYFFELMNNNGTPYTAVGKIVNDATANIATGILTYALDDIFKFTVTSLAGINTLKVYQNGTLRYTTTDSSITPSGVPSFGVLQDWQPGGVSIWNDFSCGRIYA